MGRLLRMFEGLDLLAQDLTFSVNGRNGVKSLIGSIIWLMFTLIFLGCMGYFVYTFFRTDNPVVSKDITMSDQYSVIDMSTNRRVPVIFGYIDDAFNIETKDFPRYATGLMKVETMRTHTGQDGSVSYTYDHQFRYFKPCVEVFKGPHIPEYYPNQQSGFLYKTTQEYGWCVEWKPGDLQNFGKSSDIVNQYLYFNLLPCSLESNCATEEEMSRFTVILGMGEEVLDYSNKKEPLRFSFNADDYNIVDTATFTFTQYKLMQNKILDARDFPFPESEAVSYSSIQKAKTSVLGRDPTQLSCTKAQIEAKTLECVPYLQHWYISGAVTETVTRGYKGVLDTLGGIGGLREVIYFSAFVIYMFFDKKSQRAGLVSLIYGLDESKIAKSESLDNSADQKRSRCCKKKQTNSDFVNQAYEKIEKNLDIVAFLRSLQVLDVVANLLFTEEQMQLIPVASLQKDLNDKNLITQSLGRSNSEIPVSRSQDDSPKKKYSTELPDLPACSNQQEESVDNGNKHTENLDQTINQLFKAKQQVSGHNNEPPTNFKPGTTIIPRFLSRIPLTSATPRSVRKIDIGDRSSSPSRSNRVLPITVENKQVSSSSIKERMEEESNVTKEPSLLDLCPESTKCAWMQLPSNLPREDTGATPLAPLSRFRAQSPRTTNQQPAQDLAGLRLQVDQYLIGLLSQQTKSINRRVSGSGEAGNLEQFRKAVYSLLPAASTPRKEALS